MKFAYGKQIVEARTKAEALKKITAADDKGLEKSGEESDTHAVITTLHKIGYDAEVVKDKINFKSDRIWGSITMEPLKRTENYRTRRVSFEVHLGTNDYVFKYPQGDVKFMLKMLRFYKEFSAYYHNVLDHMAR